MMNENLIVEDNTIYEIDPECLKKKREWQEREEKQESRTKGKNPRAQKREKKKNIQ